MKRIILSILLICISLSGAYAQSEKAPDLEYMTVDMKEHSLYKTKSPLTLVYLYNPQCYECIATIDILQKDNVFKKAIQSKKLTVLAVDISDDMESIIYKMYPPKGWTLCFDIYGKIKDENIFGQTHTPAMFLLNKQKRYILREPNHIELIETLRKMVE